VDGRAVRSGAVKDWLPEWARGSNRLRFCFAASLATGAFQYGVLLEINGNQTKETALTKTFYIQ